MKRESLIEYKIKLFKHLEELRLDNGLFWASPSVDYNASWWRDNFFINLAYLKNDPKKYLQTLYTSLDVLENMERKYNKLSSMINFPGDENWRYVHAKFNPLTLDEIENLGGNWGHKQFDALALFLLNIVYAYRTMGVDDRYRGLIQLLVDYTSIVSFKPDSGSWEENVELRASSSGLVFKALKGIQKYGYYVSSEVIEKGEKIFHSIFPYEEKNRANDLTLLFLPFFNIVDDLDSKFILKRYEDKLVGHREYGCRYLNDVYYANEKGEAEWCFSRAYLSIIYKKLGFDDIALLQIKKVMNDFPDGKIPELVYAGGIQGNINTPLAWSLAMYIVAIDIYLENEFSIEDILK